MKPITEQLKSYQLETPDQLKARIKKEIFTKLKSQWTYSKPLGLVWGQKTAHLKELSDWTYLKSICEDSERRGGNYSKTFWGSIK